MVTAMNSQQEWGGVGGGLYSSMLHQIHLEDIVPGEDSLLFCLYNFFYSSESWFYRWNVKSFFHTDAWFCVILLTKGCMLRPGCNKGEVWNERKSQRKHNTRQQERKRQASWRRKEEQEGIKKKVGWKERQDFVRSHRLLAAVMFNYFKDWGIRGFGGNSHLSIKNSKRSFNHWIFFFFLLLLPRLFKNETKRSFEMLKLATSKRPRMQFFIPERPGFDSWYQENVRLFQGGGEKVRGGAEKGVKMLHKLQQVNKQRLCEL